jgi:hypothetical protein
VHGQSQFVRSEAEYVRASVGITWAIVGAAGIGITRFVDVWYAPFGYLLAAVAMVCGTLFLVAFLRSIDPENHLAHLSLGSKVAIS